MLGKTHLLAGLLISLIFIKYFYIKNPVLFLIIVLLGSIFLDIDEKHSFLGRHFKLLSWAFMHRGFFHSVYALILFSLLVHVLFFNVVYTTGFFIAYFFHLFFDSFTRAGVKPFMFGLKLKGSLRTGSFLEKAFFLMLLVFNMYFLINI